MPRGKKTKKREPKRKQDSENQKEEDQNHVTETPENLAYLFKNDEYHELYKVLQKSDLVSMFTEV